VASFGTLCRNEHEYSRDRDITTYNVTVSLVTQTVLSGLSMVQIPYSAYVPNSMNVPWH